MASIAAVSRLSSLIALNDIIDYKSSLIDFQHSSEFTKLSVELEYRKLYESNRQLNLHSFDTKNAYFLF